MRSLVLCELDQLGPYKDTLQVIEGLLGKKGKKGKERKKLESLKKEIETFIKPCSNKTPKEHSELQTKIVSIFKVEDDFFERTEHAEKDVKSNDLLDGSKQFVKTVFSELKRITSGIIASEREYQNTMITVGHGKYAESMKLRDLLKKIVSLLKTVEQNIDEMTRKPFRTFQDLKIDIMEKQIAVDIKKICDLLRLEPEFQEGVNTTTYLKEIYDDPDNLMRTFMQTLERYADGSTEKDHVPLDVTVLRDDIVTGVYLLLLKQSQPYCYGFYFPAKEVGSSPRNSPNNVMDSLQDVKSEPSVRPFCIQIQLHKEETEKLKCTVKIFKRPYLTTNKSQGFMKPLPFYKPDKDVGPYGLGPESMMEGRIGIRHPYSLETLRTDLEEGLDEWERTSASKFRAAEQIRHLNELRKQDATLKAAVPKESIFERVCADPVLSGLARVTCSGPLEKRVKEYARKNHKK